MEDTVWISMLPIAMSWLVIFSVIYSERKKKNMAMMQIVKRKKIGKGDTCGMKEIVKQFVNKECIIYTFNSYQIVGTVKEVTDGAVLVEEKGNIEAVNIDFITRIKEYPKNKKGKRKAIVLE